MTYTAKPIEQHKPGVYELFSTETAMSTDGQEVIIFRSIGQFSLDLLENQKERLQERMVDVEEKINTIKTLTGD